VEVKLPETIQECHSLIKSLLVIIQNQQAEIELLRQEVSELKARLNENSQNSSRPPSGDGFNQPKPALKRKKKGRKGGQAGIKSEIRFTGKQKIFAQPGKQIGSFRRDKLAL